jgi:hypothetical protein
MRLALLRDRREGREWDRRRFAQHMTAAVRDSTVAEQDDAWCIALQGTREAWRAAYEGSDGPGTSLTLSLLELLVA